MDQKPIWIYDASAPVCCPLHFYSWQQVSALMHQIVPMETVCCEYEEKRAYLCRTHIVLLFEKSCHRLQLLVFEARLNILPFFMALLQTCCVGACPCTCFLTIHSLYEIILTQNGKLLISYRAHGFHFFTREECEDATF